MTPKIAIIVTTMLRDDLLEKCINSIIKYRPENSVILIADQGPLDAIKLNKYLDLNCFYYPLPYDCGLSYARNLLVERANEMRCDYCIIASDSMIFTEETKDIESLISKTCDTYDLIGCNLIGAPLYWIGKLNLLEGRCFELDFIDRTRPQDTPLGVFSCDIVHNFFIARTFSLLDVKWDVTLKLAEHEDFFYRYKKAGYKVAWCPDIKCEYHKTRVGPHSQLRQKNWNESLQKLYKKYNMGGWITYKNRANADFGVIK